MRSDTAFYDTILRESLSDFIQQTFLEIDPAAYYSHNWHVDLIAEYLTACYNKEIKRLIINIPPRFMKSISTSIAFPAWVLGKNPSEKVAVGSYSK
ncbi:terminase, partial [Candidatus Saccharibacteria bacterium]|nr:terminase [Candidatus Saccharibacteria bacterium]NIV03697.1 terminase [Calditrichia bacterium]NIV72003.1 terminase [Calditrichia bacterium]NIV98820.1 terminase [Candidatus Saccharibacteria bacterium]NIW79607.1 terminase [Calditrichia bacterium]